MTLFASAPRALYAGCVIVALMCSACSPLPRRGEAASIERSTVPALAAPSTAPPRSALQLVRAAYGVRQATLQCAVSVTPDRLSVIGLTPVGQRLFTFAWDGHQVSAEKAPLVPDDLDAGRLLSDLQLVLWPLDALVPLWSAAGLVVSSPLPGLRRVQRGDQLVAEVHYTEADAWHGRTWLVNFEFDYSLMIDSRAEE